MPLVDFQIEGELELYIVAQVNQAYEKVRSAGDQLASKDYAACKASLGEARALLNRSQRTN